MGNFASLTIEGDRGSIDGMNQRENGSVMMSILCLNL